MFRTRRSFTACWTFPLLAIMAVNGQNAAQPGAKLAVRAALVLTPALCATKMKDKAGETFEIGKPACTELEPALRGVFSNLTVAGDPSAAENAQIVILPRFVAVDRTAAVTSFSNRKMIVLLEWTVKDSSGKTVWLETVQGSATGHGGTIGRVSKNRKRVVALAVKDAAEQSATKMQSSPELRKLGNGNAG